MRVVSDSIKMSLLLTIWPLNILNISYESRKSYLTLDIMDSQDVVDMINLKNEK